VLDWLWQLDANLLHLLNVDWADPILDQFWLSITQLHKLTWFKYGVLPVGLAIFIYKYRTNAFRVLAALSITVALADTVAYRVVKSQIHRDRPFEHELTESWVRKVGHAHGPSFPSNHATNCFAGAAVLALYFPRRRYYFYTFAALVAISRPALGVHFPSDAIAGALMGMMIAWLTRVALLHRFRFFFWQDSVSSSNSNVPDFGLRGRRIRSR